MNAQREPDRDSCLAEAHLELRRARARAHRDADAAMRVAERMQADLDRERNLPARHWLVQRREELFAPLRVVLNPVATGRNVFASVVRLFRLHRIGPWLEPVRFTSSPLRLHAPVEATSIAIVLNEVKP